jgi:hypothetical protein
MLFDAMNMSDGSVFAVVFLFERMEQFDEHGHQTMVRVSQSSARAYLLEDSNTERARWTSIDFIYLAI